MPHDDSGDEWIQFGTDGSGPVARHSTADLPPDLLAHLDQQGAHMENLVKTILMIQVALQMCSHTGEDVGVAQSLKDFGRFASELSQPDALALIGTLSAHLATRVIADLGGPDEVMARIEAGEDVLAPGAGCGRDDCLTCKMPEDPDRG